MPRVSDQPELDGTGLLEGHFAKTLAPRVNPCAADGFAVVKEPRFTRLQVALLDQREVC